MKITETVQISTEWKHNWKTATCKKKRKESGEDEEKLEGQEEANEEGSRRWTRCCGCEVNTPANRIEGGETRGWGSRDLCLERVAAEGAGGNSEPYYSRGSPGRAGPVVFQASPEYFAAAQSSTLHCTKRRPRPKSSALQG